MKRLLAVIACVLGLAATTTKAQDMSGWGNFMGIDMQSALVDAQAASAYYQNTGIITSGINEISLIEQGNEQIQLANEIATELQEFWEEVEPLVEYVLENLGEIIEAVEQLAQELEPFFVGPDDVDPDISGEC